MIFFFSLMRMDEISLANCNSQDRNSDWRQSNTVLVFYTLTVTGRRLPQINIF